MIMNNERSKQPLEAKWVLDAQENNINLLSKMKYNSDRLSQKSSSKGKIYQIWLPNDCKYSEDRP